MDHALDLGKPSEKESIVMRAVIAATVIAVIAVYLVSRRKPVPAETPGQAKGYWSPHRETDVH
jgi:hypothetical protein